MIIVKNEADGTGSMGICENCARETLVRKVEVKKSAFGGAGRGWYSLCCECFGHRVFWRKSEHDLTVYESPSR